MKIRCRCGCREGTSSTSCGTSQRAAVPIAPSRTVPITSWLSAVTSEVDRVELADHALGAGDDEGAGFGELARGAVDELAAELELELLDVGRDVRLDRRERVGGGGERSVLGDGHDGVQLAEVHRKLR